MLLSPRRYQVYFYEKLWSVNASAALPANDRSHPSLTIGMPANGGGVGRTRLSQLLAPTDAIFRAVAFEGLLRGAGVTAAADVRTSPWSRHTPRFSKTTLVESLRRAGIAHVCLGDALGRRPGKAALFENGVAD